MTLRGSPHLGLNGPKNQQKANPGLVPIEGPPRLGLFKPVGLAESDATRYRDARFLPWVSRRGIGVCVSSSGGLKLINQLTLYFSWVVLNRLGELHRQAIEGFF